MRRLVAQILERRFGKALTALLFTAVAGLLPFVANTQGATVIHVIDGDTLDINIEGTKEHVRLIGIDTPERLPNDKAERDASALRLSVQEITTQGELARRHLAALAPPKAPVRLEYDTEARDRYGRLLAYVFLSDGTMVNEQMVLDGYAAPFTFPPNVRYVDRFREAYQKARMGKRGLWEKSEHGPGSGDKGRHHNTRKR